MAQSIQERVVLYPLPSLHQLLMHDGEVSSRPSKGDPAQLPPKSNSFCKARRPGLRLSLSVTGRPGNHPYAGVDFCRNKNVTSHDIITSYCHCHARPKAMKCKKESPGNPRRKKAKYEKS